VENGEQVMCPSSKPAWNKGLTIKDPRVAKNIRNGIRARSLNNQERISCYPSKFTDTQLQVLLGSLLGDGYLDKSERNLNASFGETHCIKQLPYLLWKKKMLSPFGTKIKIVKKGTECVLSTPHLPVFTKLYRLFYKEKRKGKIKIIPQGFLQKHLKTLGLAVWYMDDGTFCKTHLQSFIYTYCFTKKENYFLRNLICRRFKRSPEP
jgi:hypothetical protein